MSNCLMCNGTGRTKDDPYKCSSCGKEYEVGPLTKVNNFGIYIPNEYREEMWDVNKCKEGVERKYPNKAQREHVSKWAMVLDNILKSVEGRRPIPGTFFVSSPSNTSKTRWQYTLQTVASDKGYQIFPIKDVIDLNLEFENTDLIMADILILRITNYKVRDALEILNYILPKRRDKDLTTIIMSTLPFRYLNTQIDYMSFEMDYLVELHI